MTTPRILALVALALLIPASARAQERSAAEGVLHIVHWPKDRPDAVRRYELLPSIDTLSLGYRYEVRDGEPLLYLALEWKPGAWGVLDGERVPFSGLPDSLALVSLAVRAQVFSEGNRVAEVLLHADTLGLATSPAVSPAQERTLTWKTVFVHTSARSARTLMDRGFELRDPELLAVTFESYDVESGHEVAERVIVERPVPRRRTVYVPPVVPDVLIDLAWIFGSGPWDYDPRRDEDAPDSERRPRGREMGRDGGEEDGTSGRRDRDKGRGQERESSSADGESPKAEKDDDGVAAAAGRILSGRGKKSDDQDSDDEDDDTQLLPAALTAAAAVGFLAYKAGTIGYYGNAAYAPIGVSAGFVRGGGGVLLQAAANEAALGAGSGAEHFMAKVMVFKQVFPFPIQPALGAGVAVEERGDALKYRASLSAGAVGNFGPVVLLGAYDVALGGWELGAAFNFRSK